MRRGTTPIFLINIDGIDIQELKSIYVTFKQGQVEITKEKNDMEIKNNIISVKMSQEDTLIFQCGRMQVQIRAVTNAGTAVSSNIFSVPVEEILKDGVIE